jgi:hypothetical protein
VAEQDLLKAIDPYIQAENTGTAMIVFTDNSLGRIYLRAGTPVSARYRSLEGMEALEKCKNLDVRTVKFHTDTDIVRSRQVLRSNYEVLESLSRSETVVPVESPETRHVQSPQPVTGPVLTPANRQRLGRLLTDYIGPVAPLVMADLPETVDVETALSIVSREIDDTLSAADFVTSARQMLV